MRAADRLKYPETYERQKKDIIERNRAKRRVIQRYKLEVGCQRCGFRKHHAALEMHHAGLPRSSRRGGPVAWPWKEILACEVVCSNCHRIITEEERT